LEPTYVPSIPEVGAVYVATPAGALGQGTQEIIALQPARVVLPSDLNLNVRHPVVEIIVGGIVVPL